MFFRGSRYEYIPDASIEGKDGRTIVYTQRRFIPAITTPQRLAVKVIKGDRPDLVAYQALGDPEQFWRLCDANLVQRPVDLTATPDRRIVVPGPEGGG